jgi:hypothetical protein
MTRVVNGVSIMQAARQGRPGPRLTFFKHAIRFKYLFSVSCNSCTRLASLALSTLAGLVGVFPVCWPG